MACSGVEDVTMKIQSSVHRSLGIGVALWVASACGGEVRSQSEIPEGGSPVVEVSETERPTLIERDEAVLSDFLHGPEADERARRERERVAAEGRLYQESSGDAFVFSNIKPLQMSRLELFQGYRWLIQQLYSYGRFGERARGFLRHRESNAVTEAAVQRGDDRGLPVREESHVTQIAGVEDGVEGRRVVASLPGQPRDPGPGTPGLARHRSTLSHGIRQRRAGPEG